MVEIKWRERDCKSVRDAYLCDGNVRDTLSHYGLLKVMKILLMWSLRLLMQTLVSFWDVDEEVFLFQGQHIEITLVDVYFITGLPMLGVVGDLAPVLSRGEKLEELCDRHCYTTAYVHGSHILMCDIEDLSTRVVETLLLCILGSIGSHMISGGKIQLVEHAMGGMYYGWA